MKFSEIDIKCRSVVLKGIRDAFKRSDRYNTCIKESRVTKPNYNKDGSRSKRDAVFHKCARCNELYKRVSIQVDHVDPVIPINKHLVDFTIHEIFHRIFKATLQVLCKECHKVKSKEENKLRRQFRNSSK